MKIVLGTLSLYVVCYGINYFVFGFDQLSSTIGALVGGGFYWWNMTSPENNKL